MTDIAATSRRLGIDVGGTFTDVLLYDEATGVRLLKVPSTTADQSAACWTASTRSAGGPRAGRRLDAALHGTTVATNAVLEGRGARVGLIVTRASATSSTSPSRGRRGRCSAAWSTRSPTPLADVDATSRGARTDGRRRRGGRAARRGGVAAALRRAAADGRRGADGLPAQLATPTRPTSARPRPPARGRCRDLPVSISSGRAAEFREYERTITTLMNAYVAPAMRALPDGRSGDGLAGARAAGAGPGRALRRRADEPRRRACATPGADGALRPRRRRQRRRRSSRAARASTASSRSTWAARRPTSRSAWTAGRRSPARRRSATFPVRAPAVDVADDRRRRRLDRLRRRGDRRAARRPAERRRRSRPGLLRPRRHGGDGHRRQRRARPPAAAAARRRDDARRRRRPRGRRPRRRAPRARRRGDRAEAIVASSTRPCSAPCASSPCSAAVVPREFALVAFGGAGGLHANALARDCSAATR